MQCFPDFGEFCGDDVEATIFRFVSCSCNVADDGAVDHEWTVDLKWVIGPGEFRFTACAYACCSGFASFFCVVSSIGYSICLHI